MDNWENELDAGTGWAEQLVERFTLEVSDHLDASTPQQQQFKRVAIANIRRALSDSIDSLKGAEDDHGSTLPVARLKAAQVISQGKVAMSAATLYRAADQGRFYCTTPGGRSIGKVFPAWQFVDPVPELIASVLAVLADHPGSEVHAFWVTAAEQLNELCPAELLAGKPFDTRGQLHPNQQSLLALPARQRQQKVKEFAARQSGSGADVIG